MAAAPKLNFLKVTRRTVFDLSELKVKPEERHLIAPNAEWLADVAHASYAISFGIFEGEIAVGLISLIDPRLMDAEDQEDFQSDCLYVWRVMISGDQRGAGYGSAALAFAQDYARLIGLAGVSLTTKDREPANALSFYLGLGFTPTGRRIDDEIELIRK